MITGWSYDTWSIRDSSDFKGWMLMDDNTMYVKIWTVVCALLMVVAIALAAYNIVDRIGPLRPIVTNTTQSIVTNTTQFQAK